MPQPRFERRWCIAACSLQCEGRASCQKNITWVKDKQEKTLLHSEWHHRVVRPEWAILQAVAARLCSYSRLLSFTPSPWPDIDRCGHNNDAAAEAAPAPAAGRQPSGSVVEYDNGRLAFTNRRKVKVTRPAGDQSKYLWPWNTLSTTHDGPTIHHVCLPQTRGQEVRSHAARHRCRAVTRICCAGEKVASRLNTDLHVPSMNVENFSKRRLSEKKHVLVDAEKYPDA